MENIYIQTSQNINIEQSVASIGERIVAQLIDYLLFIAYLLIVFFIISVVKIAFDGVSSLLSLVFILPILFYSLVCEVYFNGQSVGKQVMKIRVVTEDGSQPGFMAYLIRWMFRLVDITATIGSVATFIIIINGKGRRLGDIAAGTRVIRLKPFENNPLIKTQALPDNYLPVFREAENLTDKDYRILQNIFEYRFKEGNSISVLNLMENAKNQFSKKLNINSTLPAKEFLRTLERDYIYFSTRT